MLSLRKKKGLKNFCYTISVGQLLMTRKGERATKTLWGGDWFFVCAGYKAEQKAAQTARLHSFRARPQASHYMMSLNLSLQGHTYAAGKPQEGVVTILQQNYKLEMCGKHNFSITIQIQL